ncbi:hypothetical protein PPO43_03550 [Saprospira sp. CCB-QB6]|uniref:hypothetical protein n=1 Tax=Saprospira sp. CCB-QB6 TaxID=3023936 RepID=UPI00234988B2|nr:hypothetical protein [Saprospira sp. CCB-QB6]WCL82177.1 hypothetical protein PPO43_03550 [Saprospira sp. CCB-QB6]
MALTAFYKKFKQKLLPHQIDINVYSHFNYQKEKFVGQAFYHHQQFSDANQYDFELNFRYQLGKIK